MHTVFFEKYGAGSNRDEYVDHEACSRRRDVKPLALARTRLVGQVT